MINCTNSLDDLINPEKFNSKLSEQLSRSSILKHSIEVFPFGGKLCSISLETAAVKGHEVREDLFPSYDIPHSVVLCTEAMILFIGQLSERTVTRDGIRTPVNISTSFHYISNAYDTIRTVRLFDKVKLSVYLLIISLFVLHF